MLVDAASQFAANESASLKQFAMRVAARSTTLLGCLAGVRLDTQVVEAVNKLHVALNMTIRGAPPPFA